MINKVGWISIFSLGTTAGGGATFFLPERLWSNAHTMTIYKKGNEIGDNSHLRVGGKEENKYILKTQNSESLLRVGKNGLENISENYGHTQNNSFWMVGELYLKESMQWKANTMHKKGSIDNDKGVLSIFLTGRNCQELERKDILKINEMNSNSKVKVSCESKNS